MLTPQQEGDAHPPARMGDAYPGWDRDAAFPELSSCYVLLLVKEPKVALCLQFTSRASRGFRQATDWKDPNNFILLNIHSAER